MRGRGGRAWGGASRTRAAMSLLACASSCLLMQRHAAAAASPWRSLCWNLPLHPIMRRAGSTCGLGSSQVTSKFQPHVDNPKIERSRFIALQLFDDSQMGEEEEGIVVDICLEDIDLSEEFVEDVRLDAHSMISSVFNPESDLDYDEHVQLSIVLCSDVWIRDLNKKWRQKDTATDVLSFPQEAGDSILGDLVISVQTAEAQAAERGHDLRHEMRVLMVHGLLHLLGYDHETGEEDKAEMAAAEDKLLSRLGWQSAGLIARVEGE